MEEKLNHMMEFYSEALDELMGAQEYAKRAHHESKPDVRAVYIRMSRQELEHAEGLKNLGEQMAKTDPMLAIVWHKLCEHLSDWHKSITEMLKTAETR